MLVKCKACGNKIDRNIAYKISNDGKNAYYCSEKEYNALLKTKQIGEEIYLRICRIFNGAVLNSALKKEWTLWREITTDGIINAYLRENEAKLSRIMQSKSFGSEYASIRYFSAILKNNLKDFASTYNSESECYSKANIEIYESQKRKTVPRKGFADIENEVV